MVHLFVLLDVVCTRCRSCLLACTRALVVIDLFVCCPVDSLPLAWSNGHMDTHMKVHVEVALCVCKHQTGTAEQTRVTWHSRIVVVGVMVVVQVVMKWLRSPTQVHVCLCAFVHQSRTTAIRQCAVWRPHRNGTHQVAGLYCSSCPWLLTAAATSVCRVPINNNNLRLQL